MNIIWTVHQLDRDSSNGFVQTAHWHIDAIDEDNNLSLSGITAWDDDKPTIPYENLTKETVLTWIWEKVDKKAIEESLVNELNAKKNPTVLSGVPWPTEEENA